MAQVTIESLSKSYVPGTPVLRKIDLEIRSGELFFLLGPSGCGKSTLLRILAGLVTPDTGALRFDGADILALPAEKRRAAMVFQNYALWPHLDVFENVAFGPRTAGVRGRALKEKVMTALEAVRLTALARNRVPQLSGGQQQRVALARALAVEPALLLLDEPLSNLDARLRDAMRHEIRRICSERNLTALYVTHDRQEALSMADRIAVMNGGRIVQLGTPEEVYDFPRDRFTAEFLGDANLLSGAELREAFGDGAAAGDGLFALRPERIRVLPAGTAGAVPARLVSRTFYGDCCEWVFQSGAVTLTVREFAPERREIGAVYALAADSAAPVRLEEER